jgi:energy-coupling factor transporter ATP-binding protein EcfA2
LQYPGKEQEAPPKLPNINLLLGNNGSGKTTILKALALAALSRVIAQSGFVPYRLVRRTNAPSNPITEAVITAEVLLHRQDIGGPSPDSQRQETVSMRVVRRGETHEEITPANGDRAASQDAPDIWDGMYDDKSPAFLIVGYGASRRVEYSKNVDLTAQQKSRLLRYQRVAGLFESHIALVPLSFWLPEFQKKNPGRHKQVVNLIDKLLPEGASFTGEYQDEEYLFELNGSKIPFGALSDGYRAYIGWVADLLYHICTGAPSGVKLVDNRGLVMVDEIDLHLHPEWQRSVTAALSAALPNIQFVFSTHSPIVAGSLNRENIFVMETESTGVSTVHQYEERIYGLNAEQVLLSSYFNLKTTRAETFTDELRDLSDLAGKGDLKAALSFMQKLSGEPLTAQASALVAGNGASAKRRDAPATASPVRGSLTVSGKRKAAATGGSVSESRGGGKAGGSTARRPSKGDALVRGLAVGKKSSKSSAKKYGRKR